MQISPPRLLALLVALQLLIGMLVWHDFALGRKMFAYTDIGSDTYFQFVPLLAQHARELTSGWPGGWTFTLGLGGNTGFPLNPFHWLNIAFGPEQVIELRFWTYLAKLVTGGVLFCAFLIVVRCKPATAIIMALAYSFSSSMTVDGQWDPHATEAALYPLVLLASALYLRHRHLIALPLAIALCVFSGIFPFSLGVFLVFVFAASLLGASTPGAEARNWLLGVFPLSILGLALAGPALGPIIVQVIDSPRVTGEQALTTQIFSQAFGINDAFTVFSQLAGLFHKDLLGIGNAYQGWMNYLEGPGFFVGLLPLLAIPQLWHGSRSDRRILLIGLGALILFIVFPIFRFAAFGFALPYFRVNNLWICLLLLFLAARGLDVALDRGVAKGTLLATITILALILFGLWWLGPHMLDPGHLTKIIILLAIAGVALAFVRPTERAPNWQPVFLLAVTALTAAWVSYPSFFHDRRVVTPQMAGFKDVTLPALALIRQYDRTPFFRLEKTFNSVSLCDALAQEYYGVKSYWFQGSSMVRLYVALGLIPPRDEGLNYTNWLPNFGDRFALYSLVGVKYLISRQPLDWPGFRPLASGYGVYVFENQFALPLGVVYTHQISAETLSALPPDRKDLLLLHAAIVDAPLGERPQWFDLQSLEQPVNDFVAERYIAPASQLQARGMHIEEFADERITGHVDSPEPGVLVFSIPYAAGWTIRINGAEAPMHRVNYGFIGTPVAAGRHSVELRYQLPGQTIGLLIAATGLLVLAGLFAWQQIRKGARQTQPSD